ncbi:MAG: hypothetical protein PHQ35_02270 [Phycisphaerae bacterium]|nr:hypothetical protein [Phycisphaerae bacterium]
MAEENQENISSFSGLLRQVDNKEKYADIFLFFLLLAFGIYHAVIYWGHQVVPHFDFECFASQGREILSFKLPADYKRVPLVGILQVLLGHIAGGECPDFHGGWLLNSILHPLTAVLLWLAGRKVIGRAAVWFAIIAILNPWGLQLLTEAIAETTLLFFIWATFYLIFIRSKWAYLLASLTTMVRYEGAALILGAFVMDMIDSKDKKQRLTAFVYAALASVPFAMWMLGTMLNWQLAGPTHYLNIFRDASALHPAEGGKEIFGFASHVKLLWVVGFCHLFVLPSYVNNVFLLGAIKILILAGFLFGSVYGLYKRQWKVLVLLLFFVPYFWIHVEYPYFVDRYYATIFAIVMLICIYGLCSSWKLIKGKLPERVIITLQVIALIIACIWASTLFVDILKIKAMSKVSTSLPYIAISITLAALIAGRFTHNRKLLTDFVLLAFMIQMIVSNQFGVCAVVRNGRRDIEFKYLLDWYKDNAKKGEKLVTTVPSILQIMAPQYKDCFIHTNTFDANNPAEFSTECYKRNISYVAWDSRVGFTPTVPYYKYWKVANISPLAVGKDVGPYQFITQLKANKERYVNLYRLKPLPMKDTK